MFEGLFNVVKGFGETWFNLVKNVLTDFSFAKSYYENWANIFGRVIVIAKNALVGPTGRGGLVGIFDQVADIMFVPLEKAFLAVWDFIKQPVIDGMNFVSKAVVDGANSIITEFNAVGQHIGLTIDKIDFSPITVEPAKTFAEHWEDGENAVSQGLANIGKIANDMGTQLKDDTDDLFVAVEAQGELVGSVMSDNMKKGLDTLKGVNKEIVKETKETGEKAGDNLGEGIKKGIEKNAPTPKFLEDKIALGKNLLGSFEKNFGDQNKGIGGILGGAFKDGMSGGSFKQVIGQAATQIGTMLAGPIGGLVAGTLAKSLSGFLKKSSGLKKHMARADTNIGQLEDIFARSGGDFNLATAEDVQALDGYNTRGLKDDRTGFAMMRQLIQEEGFSESEARLLVFNVLPKLAKGHKLPPKETRLVNKAFRSLSVRRKADELMQEERMESFEDSVEADAEAMNLRMAAGGYNGMVGKPTLFLAGEAGPEHVNITPSSRMNGGFTGGGGGNNHFTFQVSAIDARGVKEFIENDAKDFMLNVLQRESQRGRAVVYNTGVVTDPSV